MNSLGLYCIVTTDKRLYFSLLTEERRGLLKRLTNFINTQTRQNNVPETSQSEKAYWATYFRSQKTNSVIYFKIRSREVPCIENWGFRRKKSETGNQFLESILVTFRRIINSYAADQRFCKYDYRQKATMHYWNYRDEGSVSEPLKSWDTWGFYGILVIKFFWSVLYFNVGSSSPSICGLFHHFSQRQSVRFCGNGSFAPSCLILMKVNIFKT